jgi:hypothetical protein
MKVSVIIGIAAEASCNIAIGGLPGCGRCFVRVDAQKARKMGVKLASFGAKRGEQMPRNRGFAQKRGMR